MSTNITLLNVMDVKIEWQWVRVCSKVSLQ